LASAHSLALSIEIDILSSDGIDLLHISVAKLLKDPGALNSGRDDGLNTAKVHNAFSTSIFSELVLPFISRKLWTSQAFNVL